MSDTQFSSNTSLENSSGSDGKEAFPPVAEDVKKDSGNAVGENEDEDEEFTYRDSSIDQRQPEEEEDFRYPVSPILENQPYFDPPSQPIEQKTPPPQPSLAQLEAIFTAASTGDLPTLQKLFETALSQGDTQAFSLANDATSRTGLTALHAAASRGHAATVQWCK